MPTPNPLYRSMSSDGPAAYYSADMRVMLELHIPYLLANQRSTLIPIDPNDAHRYEYDLAGLLLKYSVPAQLHWIVMRLNNMTSPIEFTSAVTGLYIPDPNVIERLKSIQTTIHRMV
mgnify:CR=1 FL=1